MSRRRSRHYGMRGTVVSAGGLLLALAAGGLVGRAASAAIIPISDGRYVEFTVYMGNPPNIVEQAVPDPPFSLFVASLGYTIGPAEQTSWLTSDGIFGTGSAYTSGPYAGSGFSGTSVLDITFEVDAAGEYDLYGTLGAFGDYGGSYLRWREDGVVQFSIWGQCELCSEEFPFSTTLSLTPGVTYELTAVVPENLQTSSGGSFDVTFEAVEVIPEPSTALLLALGLVGIAAGRRRSATQ